MSFNNPQAYKPEVQSMSRQNIMREIKTFNSYKFDDKQTLHSQIDTLRKLASTCGFGDRTEARIVEKVICEYPKIPSDVVQVFCNEENVTIERILKLISAKEEINESINYTDLHHEEKQAREHMINHQKIVTKDEINMYVDFSLKNRNFKSLNEVEMLLERQLLCSLSQDDRNYVKEKYAETLIERWLDEASDNVIGLANNPIKFLHELKNVKSLDDCFSFGSGLPFNDLMITFYKHTKCIERQEIQITQKFKSTCQSFVLLRSAYLQGEIDFLKQIIWTMKQSKHVQALDNLLNLSSFLKSTEEETICFRKLLRNILNCHGNENFDHLKRVSQAIVGQDKYYLVTHVKDTIAAYLKPVVKEERIIDGRKVLEITGEHIVIGKELEYIEQIPEFNEFEEIRFVNGGVIHIDESLNPKIWHGKNIVLFTETIIVSMERKITWDVSGQDARNSSPEIQRPLITGDRIDADGMEGIPGESGGNIMVICDEIENAPNLKIVSNGGKGDKGQDGINGGDGKDGDYMCEFDFKKKFPPVSKWMNKSKRKRLDETRLNMVDDIETVKWSTFGKLIPINTIYFNDIFKTCIQDLSDIYFEARTKSGCKILFSFYHGPLLEFSQSFLLHKGSDGELGQQGGMGGVGGKGGFAGDIRVVVSKNCESADAGIVVYASNGIDGKNGISGMDGKPGNHGLDCAYIDSTKLKLPFISGVQFPKYYLTSPSDNKRLKVEYHNQKEENRIYCHHNGQFGEIVKISQESYQSCKHHNRFPTGVEPARNQHKIQGQRKKTINLNNIIEQYEDKTSMLDLNKLDILEKDINQMYEEMTDEEILKEEQVTQAHKITRTIDFSLSYNKKVAFTSICSTWEKNVHGSLTKNDLNTCSSKKKKSSEWNSLLKAKLNLQGLRDFLYKNEIQATLFAKDKSIGEHLIFRNKYQLAVLNHLEQSPQFQNLTLQSCGSYDQKLLGSVDSAVKVCKNQESLCEVESYLCNDSNIKRLSIIEMLENLSKDELFLMRIFNLYLDDYSKFDDCEKFLSDKHLVTYKKHYNYFKLKKAKSMHTKLLPILNRLMDNDALYKKLVKAISEQNIYLKLDVEHLIRCDTSLNIFYEKYIEEVNRPFVWKSILLSQQALAKKLVEGFKCAIQLKGPASVFFREVLAHIFNTNILVYTGNEHKQMVLIYNHNPSADEVVYVLIRGNECLKLYCHEGLSEITRTFEKKGQACNQIQFLVDAIQRKEAYKEEFDKLVSENHLSLESFNVSKSTVIRTKINHMLMEDELIEVILSYFEEFEDKRVLKTRLKILKHDCVGYQSFLYYISLHIQTEETSLSVEEFCCIINFILESTIDSSWKSNIISWIIACQHQTDWIVEFILLEMELYFQKPLEVKTKNSWRGYLRQTNKDICMLILNKLKHDQSLLKIEDAEEVLIIISQVPELPTSLTELCLIEWKYYLRDFFWTNQIINTGNWSYDELQMASFYLSTLENYYGKDLCCRLIKVIRSHSRSIDSQKSEQRVLNTLKLMTNKEYLFDENLLELLSKSNVHEWEDIINRKYFSDKVERSLCQLRDIITCSSNTSALVRIMIDEIVHSVDTVISIAEFLEDKDKKELNLKKWIKSLCVMCKGSSLSNFSEMKPPQPQLKMDKEMDSLFQEIKEKLVKGMKKNNIINMTLQDFVLCHLCEIILATICTSIFKIHKKTLRITQILAILTFFKTNKNVLGQVSTGEGKSFIIIAVAIMKVLFGSKVDIITSSHVLAKRDAKNYEKLYGWFCVDVGHNCSEIIEDRKTVYSKCQVVYGELSYFQRDYLLDRVVYNNNILGDRTYKTIIVDEVDSMLLDQANNVLYLSHDIPGLDKLEPIFLFIWKFLTIPSNSDDHEEFFNVDRLKDRILNEMYKKITMEDIKNIDNLKIDEKFANEIWTCLENNKVIDTFGKILVHQFDESDKVRVFETHTYGDDIKYLLNKSINCKKDFEVPCYLKQFVEDHLEKWIDSAINAVNLKSNIDYVVDVDRSDNNSDRNPNIIIVDRDTGTDMANSQWDQGLHQFLQLKHGCRVSPLTFKAVFISNVSYLKMYPNLLGLTGTLGSIRERELLKEVYNVEFVTIPTAKPKIFNEKIPILCKNSEKWFTKIFETVYDVTETRSALIICQSVSDVFTLKKSFENLLLKNKLQRRNIHTYTRDYETFCFENLEVGNIIISTNLAGRGTDIQLSEKLIESGGLHVCLTFLPNNSRIEEQAFGRSARNGQPGSGQMIFKAFAQETVSKVFDLKKERDMNEICRVCDVKNYFDTKIKPEEDLFSTFRNKYKLLKKSKHKEEVKEIILMACLDVWAFWLENRCNSQDRFCVDDLLERITKLSSDDFKTWSSQIQDPFQLTRLGLCYLNIEVENAILLFDRVINTEQDFNEAAYYYKACARTLQNDVPKKDLKELINELKFVEKKLKKRIECSLFSGQFVDYIKNYNRINVIQIDSYKQQQKILSQTYEIFIKSIQNIIGSPITPAEFDGISINCNLNPAIPNTDVEFISSTIFQDLTENKIILEKLKDEITERDLLFLLEYGICPKSFKKLILGSYNNKTGLGIEKFVLKEIKNRYLLPSREIFWKELISIRVLENEEKYVLVDHKKLNDIDPACGCEIGRLSSVDFSTTKSSSVNLYLPKELGLNEENINLKYLIFSKGMLKEQLGTVKYKFFKQENILLFNKQACFSKLVMQPVELNHFDNVNLEDFIKAGIPDNTASSIVETLVKEKIIGVKNKNSTPQYALLVNWEEIDKIELNSHKLYLSHVKSILSHCFSFRIAIQKLQRFMPLCEDNYSNLPLPLQIRVDRSLWFDLVEQDIIERKINMDKVNTGKIQSMYSREMYKEGCIKMFIRLYGREKSEQIVDDLIDKEWLKITKIPHTILNKDGVKKIFSHGSGPLYYINSEKKDKKVVLKTPKMLSENTISDFKTIKQILSINLVLSDHVNGILSIVRHLAGGIYEVETPVFSLKPLDTKLNQIKIPTSEINTFTRNGLNQVLELKEKTYTTRMKIGVFCVTTLGLVEIAVGTSLQLMLLPIGAYLVAQGIDDIIIASSCVFSGLFSWKSYMLQKAVSLVTSFISCYKNVKSLFASKTAGMSASTLKETILQTCSNLKSSVTRLFSSEVKTSSTEVITMFWKRVSVYVAEGVANGATLALGGYIQSQSELLGENLTSQIYSDIEHDITNHPVSDRALDLCKVLGKQEAKTLIDSVVYKVTQKYELKVKQTFDTIQLRPLCILIERAISKEFYNLSPKIKHLQMVVEMFTKVNKVVQQVGIYTKDIKGLVSNILIDIKSKLEGELEKVKKERRDLKRDELDQFRSDVLDGMKESIQQVFKNHITTQILSPILDVVERCIQKGSSLLMTKVRCSYLTDEEVMLCKKETSKTHTSKKRKAKNSKNTTASFSSEFDKIRCEVLKSRNNKKALTYLMPQNAAMSIDYLEICCKVIPLALRQEGLKVPPLILEVENNDTKNIYYIGDVKDETPTVSLNFRNNKMLLKDLLSSLTSSFMKSYPEYKYPAVQLQEIVFKEMETYFTSEHNENSFERENQCRYEKWNFRDAVFCDFNKINTECEERTPYQHSHCGGGWTFSPCVDVDLREKNVTNLANSQIHVNKGFEIALMKVNMHIHKIQSQLPSFNLVLDDFETIKHQIAPPPPDMSELLNCYTIQYELIVPVKLKHINRLVDFNITLCFETMKKKNNLEFKSPLGPHILYEMNPVSEMKFLREGLKGHILLNFDCTVNSFSWKDCHVAGELIVSSVLLPPVSLKEDTTSVEEESNMARCEMARRQVESESSVSQKESTTSVEEESNMARCEMARRQVESESSVSQKESTTSVEEESNVARCEKARRQVESESSVSQKESTTSVEEESAVARREMARGQVEGNSSSSSGVRCGTQNLCDVLIIGDSLFKYIDQYIKLPKCDYKILSYIQACQLNKKIVPVLENNEGLECVVLFLGNDLIKTNISEHKLVTCLFHVTRLLQASITNVKVVVCSLTFVKPPADKYYIKIDAVNRILEDRCAQENLIYVDTNRIICPRDLAIDGIHLNRSGYFKIGNRISEICQQIINLK